MAYVHAGQTEWAEIFLERLPTIHQWPACARFLSTNGHRTHEWTPPALQLHRWELLLLSQPPLPSPSFLPHFSTPTTSPCAPSVPTSYTCCRRICIAYEPTVPAPTAPATAAPFFKPYSTQLCKTCDLCTNETLGRQGPGNEHTALERQWPLIFSSYP